MCVYLFLSLLSYLIGTLPSFHHDVVVVNCARGTRGSATPDDSGTRPGGAPCGFSNAKTVSVLEDACLDRCSAVLLWCWSVWQFQKSVGCYLSDCAISRHGDPLAEELPGLAMEIKVCLH